MRWIISIGLLASLPGCDQVNAALGRMTQTEITALCNDVALAASVDPKYGFGGSRIARDGAFAECKLKYLR